MAIGLAMTVDSYPRRRIRRCVGQTHAIASSHCQSSQLIDRALIVVMVGSKPPGKAALFHGLYGGGTRGTIPRLPLGPGERCVEIVQA